MSSDWASRGNEYNGGGGNERRGMVSKIITGACAVVAACALVVQEDDDGNESGGTVMVCKVVIAFVAVMAADALVDRLFTLLSASEFETTEDGDTDNFVKPVSGTGWSFPPCGWIKCNVDGSLLPDRDHGCGGVFRGATGSWLYGFARRLETCTSSAAELEAISTALDIAWNKGFRKLILETDSLTAADVVNNNNGASAKKEKKLVKSIRNLLETRDWDVEVVHCNREVNKVADWLANLAHGLQVGDQIELPQPLHGNHSCKKLMDEDVRLANAKPRRSVWFR